MPVDRKFRDQLADILAAYLRGQDGKELREQLKAMGRDGGPGGGFPSPEVMPESQDEAARMVWACLWMGMKAGTVSCSAHEWESHCRDLAFLKSDREEPVARSMGDGGFTSFEIRLARWQLLAIAMAVALSVRFGPWVYLTCAALCSTSYLIAINVRERGADQRRRAESCFPFRDRQDWEAHRPLLQDLQIPDYDPVRHADPLAERCWWSIVLGSLMGCGILLSLTMAPVWPLWLLGVAFQSARKKPAPSADRAKRSAPVLRICFISTFAYPTMDPRCTPPHPPCRLFSPRRFPCRPRTEPTVRTVPPSRRLPSSAASSCSRPPSRLRPW